MQLSKLSLLVFMVAALVWAPPSMAQSSRAAKKEVSGMLWDPETMMRQAAENIGKRYNLNEAQLAQTHKILTEEVTAFLESHDDIWPLIRDLARFQIQGKGPEGDVARRIGGTALPLLEEVKQAILEGNARWREILTDEQKKMHDWDLKDMEQTFQKMQDNFAAMKAGASRNPGLFPQPNTTEQPPQPPAPDESFKPTLPQLPIDRVGPQEDWWQRYVQQFIEDHQLDDSQSEAAWAILKDCKARATTYRESKATEFAQADERLREARKSDQSTDVKQRKIEFWTQLQKSLNRPILDLFQELKERLERIPTDAQKLRANPDAAQARKAAREKVDPTSPAPSEAPAEPKEPAASPAPDASTPNPSTEPVAAPQ